MLWLSAKELEETFTFIDFHSIEMIQNRWFCSTWQVNWKSQFPAYQQRFFSAAIWLLANSSLKDLFKSLGISEQANPSNRMYVAWKPELKWTYHRLKASSSNILKLPQEALQGAPRLLTTLPMSWRWSTCHWTGWRSSLPKWHLRPSKCCGFLPKSLRKPSLS